VVNLRGHSGQSFYRRIVDYMLCEVTRFFCAPVPVIGVIDKIFEHENCRAQPSINLIAAAGASRFFTLIQSGERPDR
jgi:hypothetical protein